MPTSASTQEHGPQATLPTSHAARKTRQFSLGLMMPLPSGSCLQFTALRDTPEDNSSGQNPVDGNTDRQRGDKGPAPGLATHGPIPEPVVFMTPKICNKKLMLRLETTAVFLYATRSHVLLR